MYHRQGREDDHHFFHLWGAGGIGGLSSWEVSTITQKHQSEFLTNFVWGIGEIHGSSFVGGIHR